MKQRTVHPAERARFNVRLIALVVIALLLLAGIKGLSDVFSNNITLKYNGGEKFLLVHSDRNIQRVYKDLESGYYLDNFESFHRLSRLLKLEERIKPGRYLLKAGMNNFQLIRMLVLGKQEPMNVVFNYAERIPDLCGFFGNVLEADSAKLNQLLSDTSIIIPLGFDTHTIIGMFIPNTYNFYWNTGSVALINRMHLEYRKFWSAARLAKALHLGLNRQQISTLASIVQKESNKYDEMPVIAGVYLNRMKIGMPLQADPTIVFAWNDKRIRRVTSNHTGIRSGYNTYLNTGLPPGPICSPSIQAIDAVLNARDHNYLYFCAKDDFSGYHVFASFFEQHQVNAGKYQRALNRRSIH